MSGEAGTMSLDMFSLSKVKGIRRLNPSHKITPSPTTTLHHENLSNRQSFYFLLSTVNPFLLPFYTFLVRRQALRRWPRFINGGGEPACDVPPKYC